MLPFAAEDISAQHIPTALPSQLRTDRSQPLCRMSYIARRMGKEDRPAAWLVGYIRQLVRNHGFPGPIAPRLYRGEMLMGANAVYLHASWHKVAVDAWLDGLMPPPMALVVNEAEIAAHAETLDARAALVCAPRGRGRA
ncbi:hypothetical protein [Sphingomonas sp. KC8]|uniref:hypothetical protein n=1 Tax=Sphingomonas sp. KC8 TaxID=1030157 RepID=UPI000248A422|nr:hypothetical protein [Sphingomonas sp. KC8]ARS27634.1 hypothetical protein KC8_10050 [Sphingomonas sp. KC8]